MSSSTPPPVLARARRRRPRWAVVIILLTAAVGLYLGRAYLLAWAGGFLDVSQPPQAVDYAMVLGGGEDTRPFVAAALYQAGLAKGVLVAAMKPSEEFEDGLTLLGQETVHKILIQRGVPSEAVTTLDGQSATTYDEAHALRRFLKQHPQATVAVVTSDFHTRRARMIFRKALGEQASQVLFVAAPTDGFSWKNWWRSPDGFQMYIDEYLKLAFYKLAY
jgi:uncharacterized SAM-binding protein YcdF (DUF218 family)